MTLGFKTSHFLPHLPGQHSDLEDSLWRHVKGHPLNPQIYFPKSLLCFTFHSHPNSLWVEELGMVLATFPSMAPSLPITGQTFPSIQGLRIKPPSDLGQEMASYTGKSLRWWNSFLSWLQDEIWCVFPTLWGKKYLGSTLLLSTETLEPFSLSPSISIISKEKSAFHNST